MVGAGWMGWERGVRTLRVVLVCVVPVLVIATGCADDEVAATCERLQEQANSCSNFSKEEKDRFTSICQGFAQDCRDCLNGSVCRGFTAPPCDNFCGRK
jgi:hypothetical protein